MMKKQTALLLIVMMSMSLVACGGKNEPSEIEEQNVQQQTDVAQSSEMSEFYTVTTEQDDPNSSETDVETDIVDDPNSSETDVETDIVDDTQSSLNSEIAKINGGADDVGIYSVVVRLTDQAADKGVVEMVYYGAKGSPQENSIVNTFRIEYYKEEAGTFEIQTFYDGEVYLNMHHKDEVKVVNTFDATLRAGSVVISYTPDGGETQEIFSADADYFKAS